MSGPRVIAVVDKQGEMTAVWHVQTSPDAPAASGLLSGAWLLGPGEIDRYRLADLTADAHVLDTDGDGLRVIREGIEKQLAEFKAAAKAAKEANPQLTLPRFDAPETVDLDVLATAYHGEPAGQRAWAYATAVAELVEAWHIIESQRRSRKYLQEQFGAEALPLPLG
ncbi:hypothetical protein [Corynebacterium comes]|uniref:Uncharacterized protein n=1 Tax=Corynebacterium comes TaxID=2675218 RepID=A0A6B8VH66_9CORY|nr:hypothetical protein [Corynebacterium comes]QGU03513.1 hypothetical protein CETAM_01100 [Corynebacterium comes]